MKLIYDVGDKPKFSETLVFAFQQMIAIMAASLLVPILMSAYKMSNGNTLVFDPAAALFGAGAGSIVYILFTKRKSPVFLGSSFTFLGAYASIIGMNYGYWGVILGIAFAGLVYVVIALIVKGTGSGWVNKIMPTVIIGPIVTLIGLSLSGTATSWLAGNGDPAGYSLLTIVVGFVTFCAIVFTSIRGSKKMKLIPFIVGVGVGYVLALVLTLIGLATGNQAMQILSFDAFKAAFVPFSFRSIFDVPKFTFVQALTQHPEGVLPIDGAALGNIAMTFVPIGIVELAQHIGDHKNLGSIINRDLISDPGLDKTLLGDGIGSIVGGFFGGAANTTYGESIGCVAITGNASIVSIFYAAVGCMILSFFTPFVAVINSIPKCVMGGACIAMYGFIAVSGLQMIHRVDLGNNKNLYIVSSVLVVGIGGMTLNFGHNPATGGALLTVSSLATALIAGIITNLIAYGGHMGSGEENEIDPLAGAAKRMAEADFEDTHSKK